MNHEHYQQFHQSIFWLYYAKAILQAKLKQHNDAIASFTACLDAKNYAQVLMDNPDLAKNELANHTQVLKTAERNISGKSSSGSDLSTKATLVKLADKYKQVILFYEQLLHNKADITPLDFGSIFNIPLSINDSQNARLQYGYTHYHKGLCQIELKKEKEAIESFNIANKLLPDFCAPYIQKANIFKEQKSFKKALVQYDAAIRIEYNNAELYFNRSVLLFELGNKEKAKEDFARYQKLKDGMVLINLKFMMNLLFKL
jgi:tetratricopeptide (TPR) repeat protein